jgi:hypothetical protein
MTGRVVKQLEISTDIYKFEHRDTFIASTVLCTSIVIKLSNVNTDEDKLDRHAYDGVR